MAAGMRGFDLKSGGDVRDSLALARAAEGCSGIVHLAAISRVVWAERDPTAAEATNVGGTRNVAALAAERGMWVLFASSREVYGQPTALPVAEDAPLAPLNTYARTKVAGEALIGALPRHAIVRLSNVYGAADDHPDRVIPAFVRAALAGTRLVVEGRGHTFDFVHRDDAVRGLRAVIALLEAGLPPPVVHLVTGVGTQLGDLADQVIRLVGAGSITDGTPRSFDVSTFRGDPARAGGVLGWRAEIALEDGLRRLIDDFRGR
jgi:nucleoside-diphosphate-sugar epimerase